MVFRGGNLRSLLALVVFGTQIGVADGVEPRVAPELFASYLDRCGISRDAKLPAAADRSSSQVNFQSNSWSLIKAFGNGDLNLNTAGQLASLWRRNFPGTTCYLLHRYWPDRPETLEGILCYKKSPSREVCAFDGKPAAEPLEWNQMAIPNYGIPDTQQQETARCSDCHTHGYVATRPAMLEVAEQQGWMADWRRYAVQGGPIWLTLGTRNEPSWPSQLRTVDVPVQCQACHGPKWASNNKDQYRDLIFNDAFFEEGSMHSIGPRGRGDWSRIPEGECNRFLNALNANAEAHGKVCAVSLKLLVRGPGNVTSTAAGINCNESGGPGCSRDTFDPDDANRVTLTANPLGPDFQGWVGGGCQGQSRSCTVTLDQTRTVEVRFRPFTLTVTKTGNGQGTVTANVGNLRCGGVCSASYVKGTQVTLVATPAERSLFVRWTGACSGTQPSCTVNLISSNNVGAEFKATAFLLSVAKTGNGMVTFGGHSCGSDCSAWYSVNSQVVMSAQPGPDSTFTGWSDGGCPGTGTCRVTLSANKTLTANFRANTYQMSVIKTGNGGGLVQSSPSGISCGATCAKAFPNGSTVRLTASASIHSEFAGWSGITGCYGATTCEVPMTAARTASAAFNTIYYPLSLSKTGSGTITSSPAGINCGSNCNQSFLALSTITITPVPAAGYQFAGWSGACSGTGACAVTMTQAKSVTAAFTPIVYPLRVSFGGTGTGTVSSGGTTFASPAPRSQNYNYGNSVTLKAMATVGDEFIGWTGDCGGASACGLTMNGPKNVTANFRAPLRTLLIVLSGDGEGEVRLQGAVNTVLSKGTPYSGSFIYSLPSGASLTITASPGLKSEFVGTFGNSGCSVNAPFCTIILAADQWLEVKFRYKP